MIHECEYHLTYDTVLSTWGWLCEVCSKFKAITEDEAVEAYFNVLSGVKNIHGDSIQ